MFQFDIRRFDIYRKIPKDLTQPTRTGAIISVATITFCLYLLLAEFAAYMLPEIVSEVYVDDPVKSHEFIPVFLNISLPNAPCGRLGLDVQNDLSRHDIDCISSSKKKELNGGAGCHLETSFRVEKISGRFHVSIDANYAVPPPGPAPVPPQPVNLAHTIHELSIGNSATEELKRAFREVSSFTPLDGRTVASNSGAESHNYFLKIVPSIFDTANYRLFPFQFTAMYRNDSAATGEQDQEKQQPTICFRYELAPVVVKYREHEKPLYHFLTQACAIIGGSFTVSGIIDSMIFSASQVFVKARLGKLP